MSLNSNPKLWCIHGNFQDSTVWNSFKDSFSFRGCRIELRQLDVATSEVASLEEWGIALCKELEEDLASEHFLLGYSMGGRLAYHALLANPQLWEAVVVVAAHPGTSDVRTREQFLKRDISWANRLCSESIEDVLFDWDRQEVFQKRRASVGRLDLGNLAKNSPKVFEKFSKGQQKALGSDLRKLSSRLLFVAGEEDKTYCEIGTELSEGNSCIEFAKIANSAHRVPWENQADFVKCIQEFFDSL